MSDLEIKARLARELYKAAEGLGARSDLLGIIGSYGDTLRDEEVLRMLERYNRSRISASVSGGGSFE